MTSVFQPDKKKRHRDGYKEGATTLFNSISALDFLKVEDPVGALATNNEISFTNKEDQELLNHDSSTPEFRECCKDLKVLGKREFKMLLRWRLALRIHIGLDQAKEDVVMAEPAPELNSEEMMIQDLERLTKEESSRDKRSKRKIREKHAKEMMRMQLNMTAPMDVGAEQHPDDVLYNLKGKSLTDKDDHSMEQFNLLEVDSEDEDMTFYKESGVMLPDDNDVKLSGNAALFFSNPLFQMALSDEDEEAGQEDLLEQFNRDLEEELKTNKRKSKPKDVKVEVNDISLSNDEDSSSSDKDSDHDEETEKLNAESRISQMGASDSSDAESEEETLSDVEMDTVGPPRNGLTTVPAMALAQMVTHNKEAAIDSSFNRYTFGDADELPAWFVEDERKFNRPVMPISKEAVEAILERRKALDARPIKKIAEAKFRKKKRAMAKVEKIIKKAATIAETGDMTESAKALSITKLMNKKVPKSPHEKPKVVVAKGNNRGVQGRPKGVKGRYKMVDPRMRKELRATKRVAAQEKGSKRRKHK
jgi:AdoMet-dependent rRNA methyltransferase SPB1